MEQLIKNIQERNKESIFRTEIFKHFSELSEMEGYSRDIIIDLITATRKGYFQHSMFSKQRIFSFSTRKVLEKINKRNWESMIKPFFIRKYPVANRFNHTTDGYVYSDRFEQFLNGYPQILEEKKETIKTMKREIRINISLSYQFLKFIQECILIENYQEYNKVIKPKNNISSVDELKNKRDELCSVIENTTEKKYKEPENSRRLFMVSDANLQMLSSDIRKVVLSGFGNYDFDIINCHFTLIWQMLDEIRYGDFSDSEYLENQKHKNQEFSDLKQLVKNPDSYKNELSEEWLVSIPKTKQILTALVNGGAQNFSSKCFKNISIIKEQERTQQEFILKSGKYQRLKAQMKTVKEILYGKYHNQFKAIKKKDFISYLVQSRERDILDIIRLNFDCELLTFDGFVINANIPVEELEQLVFESTGFQVKYRKEPLNFSFINFK